MQRNEEKAKARFMQRRRYDQYVFSTKEKISYPLIYTGLFGILDYLFYRNLWLMVLALPFTLVMIRRVRQELLQNRRRQIGEAFRDALVAMNVAVQAGYSIENAVSAAVRDLKQLYPADADIVEEFEFIEHQLYIRVPVEELFLDFAERTGVEDIRNFATVFHTARRSGGDLSEMIEKVTRMLSDKIDVKKEINATLAAKSYEQTIMSLMPAGIIAYMNLTSPGYLDIMYGNLLGIIIMSVCLLIYLGAWWMGRKIVAIEV